MDNHKTKTPLSENILRRHAEMLEELLPLVTRLVVEQGRPADVVLARHLRTHKEFGARDRRFLSQALFAYFRWYGWTVNRLKLPPAAAGLIGTALESTEFSESFEYLMKRCALPVPVEPLGGRSITEKAAVLMEWFKDTLGEEPLVIEDLVTKDFGTLINPARTARCIEEFQTRPPAWLRIRGDVEALLKTLEEAGIAYTRHERLTDAVAVEGGTGLQHVLGAQSGQFVVQDIVSQCVGHICAPQPNGSWWDCCAGAGGKSLQLMDLMGPEGKVLASDVRYDALKELKKRARRYGIRNINTQPYNVALGETAHTLFDGVLVDAPCSGWGTWARSPDACWRTSKRDVIQCANRQLKILNHAALCVKPGGRLVYAVCTITQPETEEVVMHFMDQNPSFRLDPFEHPLTGEAADGQLQLWPWEGPGDGMFIARFVRVEE